MTQQEASHKFFRAAKAGNVSDAEAALAAGADPNTRDEWGQYTPLHFAAKDGHTAVAHLLIDKGAEVNARDAAQWTPLHEAAGNGHTDLAGLLIDKGAEVNARNKRQETPLHEAAGNGHTDLAGLLIDKGAEVNARNKRQETPLHQAALKGHTELARLLIEKGAEVNARDKWQETPLHVAAGKDHTEVADLLATAQRWQDYVKPLLGTDHKLDATQLVDQAGQPTEALKNLLPNDLFAHLGRPEFYRQGMDGLVQVFPYLPEALQASIDLVPWRRAKAQQTNAAAGPEEGLKRYVRPRRPPSSEVIR